MAVRVVEVVGVGQASEELVSTVRVVTVLNVDMGSEEDTGGFVTEVVRPGGTVANVSYGDTLPPSPVEGQIFILV